MSLSPGSGMVLDASVLINYAHVDRLDLLFGTCASAWVVEQARREVTRERQLQALLRAIALGRTSTCEVEHPDDLLEAALLVEQDLRGPGESYSFVYAKRCGFVLATDDKSAASLFRRRDQLIALTNTREIMVAAIRRGLASEEEADAIKQVWAAECRYTLKAASFLDYL